MTWLLVALVLGWIACGAASYFVHRAEWLLLFGDWPAHMQHEAQVTAFLGPIALVIALCLYLDSRREHARRETCLRRVGKLLALLAVLALAAPAVASDYGYSYGHADYSYSYHNAGWWHGKWYPAGYYYWHQNGYWYMKGYGAHYGYDYPHYEQKVKVVYKEVEPDYYASVRDYYRDSLLADAIAFRVLTAKATPAAAPPALPEYGAERPAPRAATGPAVNTPVSPALKQYVAQSCIKCHNGPGGKAGVDLSRLESAPAGLRWACHGVVVSGEMPQGGPEAPEAVLKEFYDWAKAAGKSARAEVRPDKQPQPLPTKEKSDEEALAARGSDRDPARKRK